MKKIEIYDTTLRDGTQGAGVNLSLQDKLDITVALDELGVDFVEGGWPGSNPKDVDFFNEVKGLELKSLKEYFFAFRNQIYSYERIIYVIYDDLMNVYNPSRL